MCLGISTAEIVGPRVEAASSPLAGGGFVHPRGAAVVFWTFSLAVPCAHALALRLTKGPAASWRHAWSFPFSGGPRTFAFQAVAWAVWFCSILVYAPAYLRRGETAGETAPMEALAVAGGVGQAAALLFVIKSLLAFDPRQRLQIWGIPSEIAWDVRRLPSRAFASYAVVGMGVLWAMLGAALLLASEYVGEAGSRALYYLLAAACLTTGAFTTHGLGGYLRHGRGWQVWQPFKGGATFVATQALGWALYSAVLAGLLLAGVGLVRGAAWCVRSWALAAGGAMFAAEVMLASSLLVFKRQEVMESIAKQVPPTRKGAVDAAANFLVLVILYCPMHAFCAAAAVSVVLLPLSTALPLWLASLAVYYSLTISGRPEHTGCREWRGFQLWFGRRLEVVLPEWLGSFSVVREGKTEFKAGERYIFAYGPHGLYPLGAGYVPLAPSFQKLLPPGLRPVTLTASVCFIAPLLRDILSWLGLRVVSRRTFVHTLRERGAVVVVPGGQAELVHSYRLKARREFVLYTGHKGFVRLAIEEGASLVPLLALGELDSLSNLVDLPALQRWSTKALGFPVPFLIVGRKGLPFPRKTGLRFVVGDPIAPPLCAKGAAPTPAQVDALHRQFYAQTAQLFEKHKQDFPGYKNVTLVLEGLALQEE